MSLLELVCEGLVKAEREGGEEGEDERKEQTETVHTYVFKASRKLVFVSVESELLENSVQHCEETLHVQEPLCLMASIVLKTLSPKRTVPKWQR